MGILSFLINVYIWIVIIVSLLSFTRVDTTHPIVKFLFQITEPVFHFFRSRLPLTYQNIDFTPLVVVLLLSIINHLIA
ncbi:YggT family protein [Helicobacter mustelae]|uniref:Putative membrane protein n=1 Tax=Helicobacter mustelae (strain ATCC 43772 / CCUG 25715 / CIP 103759 / LMG 18044 / NCTC 12198 / R85-136P) TaxID=679897 RepID=D3UGK3_HELM1|nr:YggT family protein [Helicobacter mustelae]CBG39624.1 putative membrane protein [Helicobacter mustelae 12198]SQH71135.1 Integral membrane protein [Helicobacter mustelae]STP12263.1 Integral membrane protein [Helicobacter mustelae]